jgi:hypothetical protein
MAASNSSSGGSSDSSPPFSEDDGGSMSDAIALRRMSDAYSDDPVHSNSSSLSLDASSFEFVASDDERYIRSSSEEGDRLHRPHGVRSFLKSRRNSCARILPLAAVHRPLTVMLFSFLAASLMSIIAVTGGKFVLNPAGNFYPRGDPRGTTSNPLPPFFL